MIYFDWTYLLIMIPAIIITAMISSNVKKTFNKYNTLYCRSHMTGAQAAALVLQKNGIVDVGIENVNGELTDHYDPGANVIRLSQSVYNSSSASAIGVACHEAGHVLQHYQGYTPIKIRTAIIPITNIGSKLAMPLIFIGLIFSGGQFFILTYIGIICFAICTVFQLVTLPVEYNASNRALACMQEYRILEGEELEGAKNVLHAAALTYVAALAVSLLQLFRLIAIAGRRR